MTVDELLVLPWTWIGPVLKQEGDSYHYEMLIRELPDYFVAGETEEEVQQERFPALVAHLQSFLENGEQPPVPAQAVAVWRTVFPRTGAPFAQSTWAGQIVVEGVPEVWSGMRDVRERNACSQ